MRIFTTMVALALCNGLTVQVSAQTYSDDFESYTPGDYMGVVSSNWTTWSGTTGNAEDVQVTTANANSGSNSLYFSSTATNGGPQDCLLLFGGEHNTGDFMLQTAILVETGKNAYFNFQANTTPGQIWSLNANFDSGELTIDDGTNYLFTTSYPVNTWFELRIEAKLNTNEWELFIDNVSQGISQNRENQVATMDLFPLNGGGYFIDDVSFTHTSYTLPNTNAAAYWLEMNGRLAGQTVIPVAEIRNLGTNPITSFDVSVDYNGNTLTENITGVNIPSMGTYEITFSGALSLVSGNNMATLTVSNVNGAADDDPADDSKSMNIDPVVPALGKLVVGEEATGSWCGWCPRGAVALEDMDNKYSGYFQGIAIHNGDPMTVAAYDAGIGSLISGYPSGLVDRTDDIDPGVFEGDFLQRITVPPVALLTHNLSYDNVNQTLDVTVNTEFLQAVSGDYRVACILLEDDVTGTGSGYNQANYYSGGSNGVMGGYESLPNPVPAADMVYDHVARDIKPSFAGLVGSFPSSVTAGSIHTNDFTFNIDASWDFSKLHVVSILIDPTGVIDNAGSEVVSNDIEEEKPGFEASLFPNPTIGNAVLKLKFENASETTVTITDITGKIIATRNYGTLSDTQILPINTQSYARGLYNVTILANNQFKNIKLLVE